MTTHTIAVEPVTDELAQLNPGATLAVVERYDGDLVKVCATDADTKGDLHEVADAYAATYGAVVLNRTITKLPHYRDHWAGVAYLTHHSYGVQVHRTRHDAQRWNEQRTDLRQRGLVR